MLNKLLLSGLRRHAANVTSLWWLNFRPRHGWVVHNQGHYYFFAEDALNWTDARNVCEEQGGHLVEIGSAAEQTYLDSIITQRKAGIIKFDWTDEE